MTLLISGQTVPVDLGSGWACGMVLFAVLMVWGVGGIHHELKKIRRILEVMRSVVSSQAAPPPAPPPPRYPTR